MRNSRVITPHVAVMCKTRACVQCTIPVYMYSTSRIHAHAHPPPPGACNNTETIAPARVATESHPRRRLPQTA